jgi:hypothetical protein
MKHFAQTQKLQEAGSLVNFMMSNNQTLPKVGEHATILSHTDRSVCIVRKFNAEKKTVVIELCDTVASKPNSQIGHQEWKHTPNGNMVELKYAYGSWKQVEKSYDFTDEFLDKLCKESKTTCVSAYLRNHNPELANKIWANGSMFPSALIEGVTKEVKRYHTMRIIFGVCDYHYDWSF